jgi:hypothetical protein
LPHNITVDDLNKMTAYFQLIQAQALSDTLKDVFGVSSSGASAVADPSSQ